MKCEICGNEIEVDEFYIQNTPFYEKKEFWICNACRYTLTTNKANGETI